MAVRKPPTSKDKPNAPFNVVELFDGEWADWQEEWPETLTDAIQRGMMDGYLKRLARAIFDRRDVLNGNGPGTSFEGKDEDAEEPEASVPEHVTSVRRGSTVKATVGAAQPAFGGDLKRGSVPSLPRGHTVLPVDVFSFAGNDYLKSAVKGKEINIPATYETDYLRGLRVKIKGVGPKRVMVEFIDLPPRGTTWRKMHDDKKPVFLSYEAIIPFLGV